MRDTDVNWESYASAERAESTPWPSSVRIAWIRWRGNARLEVFLSILAWFLKGGDIDMLTKSAKAKNKFHLEM